MRKHYLVILIFVFLILPNFFISCKKSKETKIVGEWEVIDVTGNSSTNKSTWNFTEGEELIVCTKDSAGFILNSDTAFYKVHSRSFKYYVIIDSLKGLDGNYFIEKLKKDVLVLQCKDPYIRKEMIK